MLGDRGSYVLELLLDGQLQEQVKKALESRRVVHEEQAAAEAVEAAARTAEMEEKLAEAEAAIPWAGAAGWLGGRSCDRYQPRAETLRKRFVLDMSVFHDKRSRSSGVRGDLDVQGYSKAELAELLRVPVEEVGLRVG